MQTQHKIQSKVDCFEECARAGDVSSLFDVDAREA